MAAFPDYVCIQYEGYQEYPQPSVERSDMERGPSKQMRLNSRTVVQITGQVVFDTAAEADMFETWYYDTINVIGWFTMNHPRTGQPIQARFVGGDIGQLVPYGNGYMRSFVIEYLR